MSSNPTSHSVILPNRPIVQENGEIIYGPLKFHYWEWKGWQPTILFCHACSFHGRSYDRVINEALYGYHVIAIDLRGHGRSHKHPPPYHVQWLGEDILKFIEILNLSTDHLIGIGHSIGGYAITYAAAIAPKRLFQSLLLFDPGILPRSSYDVEDQKVDAFAYILRRKYQWSSIEEMISKFETREPFSRWPKDTLRDYCTYGLDENYKLACSPAAEHAVYKSNTQTGSHIFPIIELSKFIHDIPIHVVRSSLPFVHGQFETSPTEPDLAKLFKKGRDTHLTDVKHFFPMEQPQVMIDFIREMMKENLRSNL